jgi:phosphatidylinositol glycan class A protein
MYRGVREGVRMMGNGMKVYHLPLIPYINNDVAFPVKYGIISVLRQIFIREHIDLCHGHLSTSITSAMVLYTAKLFGIKTVISEHSHFPYNDVGQIMTNKMCKFYLKEVDAAIAVSHACKDNFTLRAKISP